MAPTPDDDPGRLERLAAAIHDRLRSAPTSSPTHRALHAKGTLAAGTFEASGALDGLTTAPHLTGGTTAATMRFSHPGGDPSVADSIPSGRGMAVKLRSAAGPHDLVGVSSPAFLVRDGESFLELLAARTPDPATGQPDPARIGAFVEAHPESLPALGAALSARAPAGYTTLAYHGLHTFFLVAADGATQPFRWSWEPVDGEQFLDPPDAEGLDLDDALRRRLDRGAAAFDLVFRLGTPDDPTTDPTAIWPERPSLVAGRLEVTAVVDDGEPIIFDPTNVTAGVALPEGDEILALRRLAYGLSYATRTA